MQRIKISSAQRTYGTPYNFKIDLREPLEAGKYRLNEVYFCNSYYNVTATNNVIYWNEPTGLGDTSTTVTPGIYSTSALVTAIGTVMTTRTTTGSTFTGSYSAITGKISITATPTTAFTFLTTSLNSILPLIGFNGTEVDPSLGGALQANVNPTISMNIMIGYSTAVRDAKSNGYTYVVPIDNAVGAYVLYDAKAKYDQIAELARTMTLSVNVVDDNSLSIPLLLDWYLILERVND